ncbi:TetR/AcrR family transcriptional regulator [Actinoallomurus rhizosphaericola]|uniref:TetR/AcrR family transcriptional regulator n=1 Tax=Actinoallomurus rhizosphaericola TaxID=2952536 RepID=UPI002092182D|nr:TetR/AcrR family transcriptional regulator [Actinoallomurus rhizosphaericola]MCO6000168.1 TetR/AcrR family transcriptional regulator [Actinoallomurus rhizosphaericola]
MPRVSVRNQLIEHAEDVFRRKGFHGASVQDITRAAGAPKGSFYNHFASKEELAAEIVLGYVQATDFAALKGDGSALDRLRRHLSGQLDRIRASGVEFGCLLGTFASEAGTAGERVRRSVREALDGWIGALALTIREGQAAGEITTDRSAADLAAFLLDLLEGATLRARATEDQSSVAEEVGIALDALRA